MIDDQQLGVGRTTSSTKVKAIVVVLAGSAKAVTGVTRDLIPHQGFGPKGEGRERSVGGIARPFFNVTELCVLQIRGEQGSRLGDGSIHSPQR